MPCLGYIIKQSWPPYQYHRSLMQELGQQEVNEDPELLKIMKEIEADLMVHPKYVVQRGRLFYKDRMVLSSKSSLILTILHTYHDSGGHSSFLRTYKWLTGEIFWKNMKVDVKKCVVCQRNKSNVVSPAGLLQPLPIPNRIWEDISMDSIKDLPKSKGFDAISVVVDRLRKYGHFLPLKYPFSTKEVAVVLIKEVVWLHEFPQSIVSDRDKIFVSHLWNVLFKLQGTH